MFILIVSIKYTFFAAHIMFDDSMEIDDNEEAIPNTFVRQFMEVIDKAAR